MHKKIVQLLRERFKDKLSIKTGWGKNEVLREFDMACLELYADMLDSAKTITDIKELQEPSLDI